MIKAIETVYNGYRFRSRLEARWAVFFDALKIEYEYEKEGYYLPVAGARYLPDFWLPQVNMWAEVKPTRLSDTERLKCKELAVLTGHPVLMLEGMPMARNYWAYKQAYSYDDQDTQTGEIVYMDYALMNTKRYWECESRFYCSTGVGYPEIWNCYSFGYPAHSIDCVCDECDPFGAVRAARQARFEHGETPRVGRAQ